MEQTLLGPLQELPTEDSGTDSTGRPDGQTLRLLERQFAPDPLIAETALEPDPYEPRLLQALLDSGRYPDQETAVQVDTRWLTTDDFSLHYLESRDGGHSECWWDRYPNTQNIRLDFHEPPMGNDITDFELSSLHPLNAYSTVFEAIEQGIESLW